LRHRDLTHFSRNNRLTPSYRVNQHEVSYKGRLPTGPVPVFAKILALPRLP